MYIALYDVDLNHVYNLRKIKCLKTKRTFDMDTMNAEGHSDDPSEDVTMYIINDEEGKPLTSGLANNINIDKFNRVKFKGDDFRRIFDTMIELDFVVSSDHTVNGIFTKVCQFLISPSDSHAVKIPVSVVIPADATDTSVLADYTGEIIFINALSFLKMYLGYYGYYIDAEFDVAQKKIVFTFVKTTATKELRLNDFVHEKISTSININKATARVKDKPEEYHVWVSISSAAYNDPPINDRYIYTVNGTWTAHPHDEEHAWSLTAGCPWGACYEASKILGLICPTPNYNSTYVCIPNSWVVDDFFDPDSVVEGSTIKVRLLGDDVAYYKVVNVIAWARYYLTKNNEVYSAEPAEIDRVYPVREKIYVGETLAKAQFSALSELVNNRYVENVLITNNALLSPVDLDELELYTLVTVHYASGSVVELPIAEKATTYEKNTINTVLKLGFKKTLFTELVKGGN